MALLFLFPLYCCAWHQQKTIFSEDNLWGIPFCFLYSLLFLNFPVFFLPPSSFSSPCTSSPFFSSLLPSLCKLIYIIQSLGKWVMVRGAQHKNRKSFLFRFVNWQWWIKWIFLYKLPLIGPDLMVLTQQGIWTAILWVHTLSLIILICSRDGWGTVLHVWVCMYNLKKLSKLFW